MWNGFFSSILHTLEMGLFIRRRADIGNPRNKHLINEWKCTKPTNEIYENRMKPKFERERKSQTSLIVCAAVQRNLISTKSTDEINLSKANIILHYNVNREIANHLFMFCLPQNARYSTMLTLDGKTLVITMGEVNTNSCQF